MQETISKSSEMIDVNVFVNETYIYRLKSLWLHIPTILLLGLQALLFKKRFPAETETWLISSHIYQKCACTALKLRETMSKLTDAL